MVAPMHQTMAAGREMMASALLSRCGLPKRGPLHLRPTADPVEPAGTKAKGPARRGHPSRFQIRQIPNSPRQRPLC
jgi:hypothetical protein